MSNLCVICNTAKADRDVYCHSCNITFRYYHYTLNEELMECSGVMKVAHCDGCKKGKMPWKDSRVKKPNTGMMVLLAESEQSHPMIGWFKHLYQPNKGISKLRVFKCLTSETEFIEEENTVYHWIYRDDLKAE